MRRGIFCSLGGFLDEAVAADGLLGTEIAEGNGDPTALPSRLGVGEGDGQRAAKALQRDGKSGSRTFCTLKTESLQLRRKRIDVPDLSCASAACCPGAATSWRTAGRTGRLSRSPATWKTSYILNSKN